MAEGLTLGSAERCLLAFLRGEIAENRQTVVYADLEDMLHRAGLKDKLTEAILTLEARNALIPMPQEPPGPLSAGKSRLFAMRTARGPSRWRIGSGVLSLCGEKMPTEATAVPKHVLENLIRKIADLLKLLRGIDLLAPWPAAKLQQLERLECEVFALSEAAGLPLEKADARPGCTPTPWLGLPLHQGTFAGGGLPPVSGTVPHPDDQWFGALLRLRERAKVRLSMPESRSARPMQDHVAKNGGSVEAVMRDLAALLINRRTDKADAITKFDLFSKLQAAGHREPEIEAAIYRMRQENLIEQGEVVHRVEPPRSVLDDLPAGVFNTPIPRPEAPEPNRWWVIWPLAGLREWWEDQQMETGDEFDNVQAAVARLLDFVATHRGQRSDEDYAKLLTLDQKVFALCQVAGITIPPVAHMGSYTQFTPNCKVPIGLYTGSVHVWLDEGWQIAMKELSATARRMGEKRKRQLQRPEAGESAAGGEPRSTEPGKKKGKRGRPSDTDPKADKRVFDAWHSGHYKTYAELARELKCDEGDVSAAIDRHRKRAERKQEERRTKSTS